VFELFLVLFVTGIPFAVSILSESDIELISILRTVKDDVLLMSIAVSATAMFDGIEALRSRLGRTGFVGFVDQYMYVNTCGILLALVFLLAEIHNDDMRSILWLVATYLLSATNIMNASALSIASSLRRSG
jgi:hypothetical protein